MKIKKNARKTRLGPETFRKSLFWFSRDISLEKFTEIFSGIYRTHGQGVRMNSILGNSVNLLCYSSENQLPV